MPEILEIIRRLLPEGTEPEEELSFEECPRWPPDLFAVSATLLSYSGCYSQPRYTEPWNDEWFFGPEYLEEVQELGQLWRRNISRPNGIKRLWHNLIQSSAGRNVVDFDDGPLLWQDTAMKLMAIADEASMGLGLNQEEELPFAAWVYQEHRRWLDDEQELQLPCSLCLMVPKEEVCVQPKTVTPTVGCTLRSFSHNLALLPAVGKVATSWLFGHENSSESLNEPLNLLLVPFPYRLDGSFIVNDRVEISDNSGHRTADFFALRQTWLEKLPGRRIADFLIHLLQRSKEEVGKVHGIILPEAALKESQAQEVSTILAQETELEMFLSGILSDVPETGIPQNCVFGSLFPADGEEILEWRQSKHHRWRLDRSQIQRYHLGHVLDPEVSWWEKIDIRDRQCFFYRFRYGASLAVLVCEDLGRIEPVQEVIRAVGPNLLITLLMDGPQLERRWPGRYATVLADDPGSGVLTFTCLGMVLRSNMPGEQQRREIALWKEPGGQTHELRLPQGDHALLLTLSTRWRNVRSMDGRPDHHSTRELYLSGSRGIEATEPFRELNLRT